MKSPHPIRPFVFFAPLSLLVVGLAISLVDVGAFIDYNRAAVSWILDRFGWMFSWSTFLFVLLLVFVYFSPLSKRKIGGEKAVPILNRWRWFAITLCTTIATGILFWGTAEPVYYLQSPPAGSGDDAGVFAMSTLFMHWTITPYAIYTVAGLSFALAYYNQQQAFSLSAMLHPLLGERAKRWATLIDAVCLFALVAGMSASLGAGILSLSGGIFNLTADGESPVGSSTEVINFWTSAGGYALLGGGIVLAFLLSAASGLQRGIRTLSNYNAIGFIVLAILVLAFGPIAKLFSLAGDGLLEFGSHFLSRSTNIANPLPTDWQHDWTIFYWANWFAWAPVSALFLGRLSVGYRVRDFIHVNWILPALFGGLWMVIFGGSAIELDAASGGALQANLSENGPESIIYQLFDTLPATELVTGLFVLLVFLSYVTAADSNISAMGAISVKGINPERPEAPLRIRLVWGVVIGTVSWVMISFAGIDGIRLISVVGGFPAMILISLVGVGLLIHTLRARP
ncbi:MAG: BCCT family transporter [Bacteroidota bacterium]